jgi:transposase InsO family protein
MSALPPKDGVIGRHLARYAANRLRIVRQVRYSSANENCIDLVLFLYGLPVATTELKTDFTQCVEDAIYQYRFDRNPRPKGQPAEPLLTFPSGAVVHFAVSNGIAISMDGKGAWRDNVFVERLWRSVKYEEVYLKAYDSVSDARASLGQYFDFYNGRRPHSSLDGATPDQAYFQPLPLRLAA